MSGWLWFAVAVQILLLIANAAFFVTFLLAGNLMWIVSGLGVIVGLWCIGYVLGSR